MPTPIRTARTLLGVAVVVIALGVQQTYSNVGRRPTRDDRPTPIETNAPDTFTLARLYLHARQPVEAEKLFQRLRKSSETAVSRETLAAYLGLCAELQGDHAGARAWYRQAGDYFEYASARLPRRNR